MGHLLGAEGVGVAYPTRVVFDAVTVGIEPHSHGLRLVTKCLAKVGPEVFFGTPEAHVGRIAFGWVRGTVRTKVVVGRRGLPGMSTLRSLEIGTVYVTLSVIAIATTNRKFHLAFVVANLVWQVFFIAEAFSTLS